MTRTPRRWRWPRRGSRYLAAPLGAQRRVAVVDVMLLIGFGDAEQHPDHPHRHLRAEIFDEVEPSGVYQRIEAACRELPDPRLQRADLPWGEDPGEQLTMDVVDRRILEDQAARRNLHTRLDDFQHGPV